MGTGIEYSEGNDTKYNLNGNDQNKKYDKNGNLITEDGQVSKEEIQYFTD